MVERESSLLPVMELSKDELRKRLNSMISSIYFKNYELQQKAELIKSQALFSWMFVRALHTLEEFFQ